MPTSAPGSRAHLLPARRLAAGFTLLELLVVISIIAIAAAGVSLAIRDSAAQPLERDAQRLAALLESARARSRMSGTPVRWVATETGFRFDGLPEEALPREWLGPDTRVVGRGVLLLGPEPVIPPQAVVIGSAERPGATLRIATDGLRPFSVSAESP